MSNIEKNKEVIVEDERKDEFLLLDEEIQKNELPEMVPQMNLTMPNNQPPDAMALISDERYLGVLDEILNNIRDDRKEVSSFIDNLAEMVLNEGDATSSTKEALVNMVKTKTDLQDKMLKVADLMTRLKAKNTFAYSGAHLNAVQQNNYNIGADGLEFNKKELIRAINQAKKKKDKA
jgi:hypothetical protein